MVDTYLLRSHAPVGIIGIAAVAIIIWSRLQTIGHWGIYGIEMRPGELKVVMLRVQDAHQQAHYYSGDIGGYFDRIKGGGGSLKPLLSLKQES